MIETRIMNLLIIVTLICCNFSLIAGQELSPAETGIIEFADRFYRLSGLVDNEQTSHEYDMQIALFFGRYSMADLIDFKNKFGSRYISDRYSIIKAYINWASKTKVLGRDNLKVINLSPTHFTNADINWQIKFFFSKYIAYVMGLASLNLGDIVRAYIDGSGFCTMFKHPNDQNSEISRIIGIYSDDDALFAKFGYLISTIAKHYDDPFFIDHLTEPDTDIKALLQLAFLCRYLEVTPLSSIRRKIFLSKVLGSRPTIAPEIKTREIPYDNDICKKLMNAEENDVFIPGTQTMGIFLDECLDDISNDWKNRFDEWQPYTSGLLQRWTKRIERFVELSENDLDSILKTYSEEENNILNAVTNKRFSKYLQKVMEEVPAIDARLAYEQGKGLCDSVLNSNVSIYTRNVLKVISKYWLDKNYKIMALFANPNEAAIFIYLNLVCQHLHQKSLQKNDIPTKNSRNIIKL